MRNEILIGLFVLIASVLFFSFKAGDIGLQFTGDENFYYQSAKNMVESGDWLTPRYYGTARFQKPILYYWLVAASFKIFGINWFAARLPSVLLGGGAVLLTFLIGNILFKNTYSSLLSASILATTFKFFKYARFAIPDMALLFFMTLSLYIFIKGTRWPLFFISLALATLIKGPIGLVIPVLVITIFVIFSKGHIAIKRTDIILGIILYIIVTAPWFLIMVKLHGKEYISAVWTREIAHRVGYFADTKIGASRLSEYLSTLFFYIPIIFIRFLPWSVFLPKGIKKSKHHFLLPCWFFTVFIFFTLMGEKHSQYMLPLSVPFALMVGLSFSQRAESGKKNLTAPFVIALFTALIFLTFSANKEFRLNNAILGGFAAKISDFKLTKGDKVSMGSHELIPQQLEVYLDRPVEKLGGKWYDPKYHEDTNRMQLEHFFNTDRSPVRKSSNGARAFCIIKREDYQRYISPELKEKLKIVYKDLLWKRKIRITKEDLALLLKGEIKLFIDSFKDEYYLIYTEGTL